MCQERLPGEGGGSSPKNLNKGERKNGQINTADKQALKKERGGGREREMEREKETERERDK